MSILDRIGLGLGASPFMDFDSWLEEQRKRDEEERQQRRDAFQRKVDEDNAIAARTGRPRNYAPLIGSQAQEEEVSSPWTGFGYNLGAGALSGAAAMPVGAAATAATAPVLGPFSLLAGLAAGGATALGSRFLIDKTAETVAPDFFSEASQSMADYPEAAYAGEIGSMALLGGPATKGIAAAGRAGLQKLAGQRVAPELAAATRHLAKDAAMQATIGGSMDAAAQYYQTGEVNPLRVAGMTVAGGFMSQPWGAGKFANDLGFRMAGKPAPVGDPYEAIFAAQHKTEDEMAPGFIEDLAKQSGIDWGQVDAAGRQGPIRDASGNLVEYQQKESNRRLAMCAAEVEAANVAAKAADARALKQRSDALKERETIAKLEEKEKALEAQAKREVRKAQAKQLKTQAKELGLEMDDPLFKVFQDEDLLLKTANNEPFMSELRKEVAAYDAKAQELRDKFDPANPKTYDFLKQADLFEANGKKRAARLEMLKEYVYQGPSTEGWASPVKPFQNVDIVPGDVNVEVESGLASAFSPEMQASVARNNAVKALAGRSQKLIGPGSLTPDQHQILLRFQSESPISPVEAEGEAAMLADANRFRLDRAEKSGDPSAPVNRAAIDEARRKVQSDLETASLRDTQEDLLLRLVSKKQKPAMQNGPSKPAATAPSKQASRGDMEIIRENFNFYDEAFTRLGRDPGQGILGSESDVKMLGYTSSDEPVYTFMMKYQDFKDPMRVAVTIASDGSISTVDFSDSEFGTGFAQWAKRVVTKKPGSVRSSPGMEKSGLIPSDEKMMAVDTAGDDGTRHVQQMLSRESVENMMIRRVREAIPFATGKQREALERYLSAARSASATAGAPSSAQSARSIETLPLQKAALEALQVVRDATIKALRDNQIGGLNAVIESLVGKRLHLHPATRELSSKYIKSGGGLAGRIGDNEIKSKYVVPAFVSAETGDVIMGSHDYAKRWRLASGQSIADEGAFVRYAGDKGVFIPYDLLSRSDLSAWDMIKLSAVNSANLRGSADPFDTIYAVIDSELVALADDGDVYSIAIGNHKKVCQGG